MKTQKNINMPKIVTAYKKESAARWYDNELIKSLNCTLNLIVGGRNIGKSYDFISDAVIDYWTKNRTTAFLRRHKTNFSLINTDNLYNDHETHDFISKVTGGEWTSVCYWQRGWYLCKYVGEDRKRVKDKKPFMYAIPVSTAEDIKSGFKDPMCYSIIFDEFLATADQYLPNEWMLFSTIISTIQRTKPDEEFRIYLLGNSLNAHSLYFRNLGIKHFERQEWGTIQVYEFAPSDDHPNGFKMAVELCSETGEASKTSGGFFYAFDDPTARMTRGLSWEIEDYPLKKNEELQDITKDNIIFTFFVEYDDETIQCEIVEDPKGVYVFCHPRSARYPIDRDNELIYTEELDIRANIRDTFLDPRDKIDASIKRLYLLKHFRYSDNEVGDLMKNFLEQQK